MKKFKINRHTFSSLKIRNYRLYFIGQAISLCGTWMQSIGQIWLVLEMTHSGVQLGLVAAAQTLPILFFGPWGGLITDRFPKRKLLYITQTIAGVLAFILGVLVITHTVELWMIYILAIALGLVNALDNPTRQTFVMEMVGKEQLQNAVSLNSTEVNLARVIGPAIGAGIIAAVGLAPLFVLNAISYIAVLGALFMMRSSELHLTPAAESAKGQLREGFRYVMNTPALRDTLLMMAIIGTLTYEFTVSIPLLAQVTFHGTATTYALITVVMGLGSLIGGLYAAGRKSSSPRTLVLAAWCFGGAMLLAAVMPTISLTLAAMLLVGFFSIIFLSLGNVILQLESNPKMRGRVMSLWAVAFLGSTPIGGPIIGWIGQYAGPRWGLIVGALAACIAAAWGSMNQKLQKRTIEHRM